MILKHAGHVAWRQVGEEFIVLDLKQRRMLGLSPGAAVLWQAFGQPRCATSLIELQPEHWTSASLSLLTELQELELLVTTSEELHPEPLPVIDEEPEILWREGMQQVAGTCAFFPAQSNLCNQNPFN